MFHETISDEQLDVLKKLSGIKEVSGSFYLAGGTSWENIKAYLVVIEKKLQKHFHNL